MHTVEEIAALLHIHEKAHANGGLPNIAASALDRLRAINNEMGPNGFSQVGPPQTEPEPEPEAEPTEEEPAEEETEHAA